MVALDFSQRTKSAERLAGCLAPRLVAKVAAHCQTVHLLLPSGVVASGAYPPNVVVHTGAQSDTLWEEWILPRYLRRNGIDLLFTFREGVRTTKRTKIYVHLHEDPGVRRRIERRGMSATPEVKRLVLQIRGAISLRRTLRSVDMVSFSSEATKHSLRRRLRRDLANGPVIYLGGFGSADSICTRAERRHVLTMTSSDARDEITWVEDVWAAANGDRDDAPPLVVIGGDADEGTTPRYVPEVELKRLMATAIAYIHPARFEGFGLPVAEALSLGTPVVTQATTSLVEVAGPGAFASRPAAARRLRLLIDRPDRWDKASAEAVERAGRFSWDTCAESVAHRISAAL